MPCESNLALVVPFFNESRRWNPAYWVQLQSDGVQLFFIDDGSTDDTGALLAEIDGAILTRLDINVGKAEAVRIGMKKAAESSSNYFLIGFLDADGAFDADEVVRLLRDAPYYFDRGFDAIWSSRVKLAGREISRSKSRRIIGRVISLIISLAYRDMPYDTQSGFKIYRNSQSLISSLSYRSKTRWFFELEHLTSFGFQNTREMKIWETPINRWSEINGSKIYNVNSFLIFSEIVFVLYRLLRVSKLFKC